MPEHTYPSRAELEFYYFGFYGVLRRYRTMTVLGWAIVALGVASIPLSWRLGTPHGILDTALSLAAILAGLLVVQQCVTSLSSYVRVPFHEREAGTPPPHPALQSIEQLMRDVDEGGWQDAFTAIRMLERMQDEYGLPPLAGGNQR
jgi:hypothetical protein